MGCKKKRHAQSGGDSLSFIGEDGPPGPGMGPGLRELKADDEAAEDEAPDEQDALEQRGLLVVVAVAVAVVGEEIGGDEGHRPFERVAVGR